jgi:hypothetical protein
MLGVPRELIEHRLHLDPLTKPVKQRIYRLTQDKKDVIKKEIARLLEVDFIKEVYHPNWLANPVLVPKKNKEWRMCADYTNLNKTCKNDPFGLPRVHQVVDSTTGCSLQSFLHCYSGYYVTPPKVEDQIKTIMPFGLKSASATCQRGIQWCLYSQLGRNAEVYVHDMVVKTWEEEGLVSDLVETFDNLRKLKMKLTLEKCTFDVPSGRLLGYMVSHSGIDPNLEKVLAITKMKPHREPP